MDLVLLAVRSPPRRAGVGCDLYRWSQWVKGPADEEIVKGSPPLELRGQFQRHTQWGVWMVCHWIKEGKELSLEGSHFESGVLDNLCRLCHEPEKVLGMVRGDGLVVLKKVNRFLDFCDSFEG